MSDATYYRVVCNSDHEQVAHEPVLLADITCDPDQEAWQRHQREQRRWDRHNSGEEPIPVEEDRYRRPYPRDFRPYMPRTNSKKITVRPYEHMFFPELVDPDQADITTMDDYIRDWERTKGKPRRPYSDGYMRVTNYEMDHTEHPHGRKITIGCALCKMLRGNSKPAKASADRLALALARINPLDIKTLPLRDENDAKLTDETVEVRIVTLLEVCRELGGTRLTTGWITRVVTAAMANRM